MIAQHLLNPNNSTGSPIIDQWLSNTRNKIVEVFREHIIEPHYKDADDETVIKSIIIPAIQSTPNPYDTLYVLCSDIAEALMDEDDWTLTQYEIEDLISMEACNDETTNL